MTCDYEMTKQTILPFLIVPEVSAVCVVGVGGGGADGGQKGCVDLLERFVLLDVLWLSVSIAAALQL